FKLTPLRLVDLDLQARLLAKRGSLRLALQILVDKGFGDEAERLAFAILESGGLLVGHPRIVACIDLGDESKFHRVAFTRPTIELINHAAGDSGDPRTVRGLVQNEIVNGAVRGKRGAGESRKGRKCRLGKNGNTSKAQYAHINA